MLYTSRTFTDSSNCRRDALKYLRAAGVAAPVKGLHFDVRPRVGLGGKQVFVFEIIEALPPKTAPAAKKAHAIKAPAFDSPIDLPPHDAASKPAEKAPGQDQNWGEARTRNDAIVGARVTLGPEAKVDADFVLVKRLSGGWQWRTKAMHDRIEAEAAQRRDEIAIKPEPKDKAAPAQRKPRENNAALEAAAKRGSLPPIPQFSAANAHYQKKADAMAAAVAAGDLAALNAVRIGAPNGPNNQMTKYRQLALIALSTGATQATKVIEAPRF